jgi:hypothetical protein
VADLVGPGAIVAAGPTSAIFSTPFPHRPGDKARDRDGNEYLFVDFTATTYYGCLVQIDELHRATPLLGTANLPLRVGVVCSGITSTEAGNHPTSDNGGWVQIYGVHPAVQTGVATDGGVSATAGGAYFAIPQTSIGSPSGTLSLQAQAAAVSVINTSTGGNQIYNLWVVDLGTVTDLPNWIGSSGASGPSSMDSLNATSGAATSAFIGQTYAVFLNYPYVLGLTVPMVNTVSDS